MRDHRLVDCSRKLCRQSVCSTEVLTLRLLPPGRFPGELPSSVVKQHQSPTVLACKQVPSALVKVYLVFCNLCKDIVLCLSNNLWTLTSR
jgi:hypothetical protein